jgi:hypothetical protein
MRGSCTARPQLFAALTFCIENKPESGSRRASLARKIPVLRVGSAALIVNFRRAKSCSRFAGAFSGRMGSGLPQEKLPTTDLVMRTCRFPMAGDLLASSRFAIVILKAAHSGRPSSQGGVKLPTGGKGGQAQARERLVPSGNPLLDSLGKKGQQIRCDSEADG